MTSSFRASIAYVANRPLDEFRETVEAVDNLGYEDLFVADQSLRKNTYAWAALAAEHTAHVGIGPGVTNPYTRNPGLTAASMATIDEISGGRAKLGFGAGGHGAAQFGHDQSGLIATMREAIDVIRRLLAGETVTVEREEFSLREAALEFDPPREHVPVYIGGRGPQLLSLAGAVADGVFAGGGLTSPAGLEYARERVRIGAEAAGRDPAEIDFRALVFLSIAEDRKAALDAAAWFVAMLTKRHASPAALEAAGADPAHIDRVKGIEGIDNLPAPELRAAIPEELMDLYALVGTPEECRDRLGVLADAGLESITVVPFGNEENDRQAVLGQFADEVVAGL